MSSAINRDGTSWNEHEGLLIDDSGKEALQREPENWNPPSRDGNQLREPHDGQQSVEENQDFMGTQDSDHLLKNSTDHETVKVSLSKNLPDMAAFPQGRGAEPNEDVFNLVQLPEEKFFQQISLLKSPLNMSPDNVRDESKRTVLHVAVLSKHSSNEVVKYILNQSKGNAGKGYLSELINAQDKWDITALQYAAVNQKDDIVEILLQHDANIFLQNMFGQPTFYFLRPEVMEIHLDKKISLTDVRTMKLCELKFDFNFLQSHGQSSNEAGVESGRSNENSQKRGDNKNGMAPLSMISETPTHEHLLLHPVLRAFLHFKWKDMSWCYWINFGFFLYHMIFTFLFLLGNNSKFTVDNVINDKLNEGIKTRSHIEVSIKKHENYIWRFTLVLNIFLFAREICQCVAFKFTKYILDPGNWLDAAIVSILFVLLFDPRNENYIALSSTLSLCMALEVALLMSRHPVLAIYVNMFFEVSWNFIKFILWYMSLIIAFSFAFYTVFPFCEQGKNCNNFFNTIPDSLFKTMIMITGEFESGDIDFEHVPIFSRVIFIFFMLFITMVMVNLLNGLAVSDTQQIRNNALLIYCKSQTTYLTHIESIFSILSSVNVPYFRGFNKFIKTFLLRDRKEIGVFINNGNSINYEEEPKFVLMVMWKKMRIKSSPLTRIVSEALKIIERVHSDPILEKFNERLKKLEIIVGKINNP